MAADLSNFSNEQLRDELTRRENEKRQEDLRHYTPTEEEMEAAKREHWNFSFYRGFVYVDNGDAHPYSVIEHGRWQTWLDNHRRFKKLKLLRG